MNELYDIAIIGSGVAGLQAAINATLRKKNIIVFGNKNLSTKLVKAHRIILVFMVRAAVKLPKRFKNIFRQ